MIIYVYVMFSSFERTTTSYFKVSIITKVSIQNKILINKIASF